MIGTYQMKGAVRDLGKALGLPAQDMENLTKRIDSHDSKELELEIFNCLSSRAKSRRAGLARPDRVGCPVWMVSPKYLAQHPGGMIISSSPLIDTVPVQQAAITDRYICQWDKDSIDQGPGF
ncbi:MAG: hypothetical protein Ct9H300mP11_30510 [Chloroflexota bacterium]|nr:MAG: hypothetical protein Ct9H300mP11_30510 [Chloroflexota bacterium]